MAYHKLDELHDVYNQRDEGKYQDTQQERREDFGDYVKIELTFHSICMLTGAHAFVK
jgi:hypothetical protein